MTANPRQHGFGLERASLLAALLRYGLALAYAILLCVIYRYLSDFWTYLGFRWSDPNYAQLGLVCLAAAAPSLVLPIRVNSLFAFFGWSLHYLLFIPATIIPYLQGFEARGSIAVLVLVVVATAVGFGLASRMRLAPFPPLEISSRTMMTGLFWVFLAGQFYVLIKFRDTLSFAGVDDIYEQRSRFSAGLTDSYDAYLLLTLSNAINPFVLALGLYRRNWWLAGAGAGGQVLAYSTLALKSILLSPVLIVAVYLLFDSSGRFRPGLFSLSLVLLSLIAVTLMPNYQPSSSSFDDILSLIFFRTLYMGGALVGIYSDFFSIYPWTYFSYSSIGRIFTEYPYGALSIGQAVGLHVVPTNSYELLELNASFLATDGIGSLGKGGVIVILPVVIGVFWVLSRASAAVPKRIVFPATVPFLITVTNTSILSSLLSGGGMVLGLLFYLLGSAQLTEARKRRETQVARAREKKASMDQAPA